jgi:hypothetical protein
LEIEKSKRHEMKMRKKRKRKRVGRGCIVISVKSVVSAGKE